MTRLRDHMEAIGTALLLIQKLPEGVVWSLTCTDDDDAESPSVLNIYAAEERWDALRTTLRLGRAVDKSTGDGEQFLSFRQGTLLVSLIEEDK